MALPRPKLFTLVYITDSIYFRPASHDPTKMTVTITPWYHVLGLVGLLTAFATGRTGVFLPKFDVELYLRTIEKYKVCIILKLAAIFIVKQYKKFL